MCTTFLKSCAQVLQWVFAKFGDLYTLLDVYNISEKLCVGFTMGFCKIWRFVHFVGCVQHF
jgi:hypothetical protein